MKIRQILEESEQLFKILQIIDSLGLKDAWLSAGTLRNLIWNKLSGYTDFNQMSDIDVVFFDDTVSYEKTCQLEQSLRKTTQNIFGNLKIKFTCMSIVQKQVLIQVVVMRLVNTLKSVQQLQQGLIRIIN